MYKHLHVIFAMLGPLAAALRRFAYIFNVTYKKQISKALIKQTEVDATG